MGGRGSTSSTSRRTPTAASISAAPQQNVGGSPQQPQEHVNNAPMPMTLSQVAKLDDAGALNLLNTADGMNMPNHLKDAKNATQELVYTMGLNEAPIVLDKAGFDAFMKANGLTKADIIHRGFTSSSSYTTSSGAKRRLTDTQCRDMYLYDEYNYIGGKHGGNAIGDGSYFGRAGSVWGSYTGADITAVLNPAKAKVISYSNLQSKISAYQKSHPGAANKIESMAGNTARNSGSYGQTESKLAMYAIMMGYNVIQDSSRDVIIGREALVCTI